MYIAAFPLGASPGGCSSGMAASVFSFDTHELCKRIEVTIDLDSITMLFSGQYHGDYLGTCIDFPRIVYLFNKFRFVYSHVV